MRSRISLAVSAAIVGTLLAAAVPAFAENTVTLDEATHDNGKGTAKGTVSFDPIAEAQSVGGTNVDWQANRPAQLSPLTSEIAKTGGIDLVDAKIEPLADGSGLRFIWVLEDLPEQVPPEGVRYVWGLKIGETQYQLQAKRTNLLSISTVEDPVNYVEQVPVGTFFSLRGACTPGYVSAAGEDLVSGCYHLTFLDGSMDATANTVSIDWPFNTKDSIGRVVAPDFKPGAVITENTDASMYIGATFQAVVSNNEMADRTTGWLTYWVGPAVDLAIGAENVTEPSALTYGTPATLAGGNYEGQVSGLSASKPSIWVRACSGVICVYTSRKVVL